MKILYVTTISLTMNSFFKPHIKMLLEEGHTVDLACNSSELELDRLYKELGCKSYNLPFSRNPLSRDNVTAYKQLKRLVEKEQYDIVHCHTPNASVCTRLACKNFRRDGLRVFYTAHGFHFYKGAPLLNWLIFYPVEKFCSKYTDKLITINQEDYQLAKKRMKAKEVCYVPGVGIDLSRFENIQIDKKSKRQEINIPEEAFLLLSVGELNKNKNHQIIIRALAKVNNSNIHYVIAGIGDEEKNLRYLSKKLGILEQVHILGYRKDISELNYASDVFCFPSYREGLGLAAIEAMACGLPLITSNIHGINDYSKNEKSGFKCKVDDVDGFVRAIKTIMEHQDYCGKFRDYNLLGVRKFEINKVTEKLKEIYQ